MGERTTWTDALDAKLAALAAEGRTAEQVGAEFGMTRNAVLGRAHRIGVKFLGHGGRRSLGATVLERTRRAEVSAANRARVLEAARRLFRERGYEAVGVRDIATEVGATTGLIFTHWAGKDDLFAEAMGRRPITDAMGAELLTALDAFAPRVVAMLQAKWAA